MKSRSDSKIRRSPLEVNEFDGETLVLQAGRRWYSDSSLARASTLAGRRSWETTT